MASNSRYNINYTLSVFEKTEAGKLIKEREKHEFIKPYGIIHILKKSAFIALLFAAITNLIILLSLIFLTENDPGFLERAKYLAITTFVVLTISIGLFYFYDFFMKKTMRNNHSSEINDTELIILLKINRSYIEQIMRIGSSKYFWNYIKKTYRKEGYIFIQSKDNGCIVIPERIFKHESEINKLHEFIKEQVLLHKENR
ncbi:YcxB family protein [Salmonella enterica]|nr:YcxB family protein [Salmonella enterica]EDC2516626.1 YcxB family protein [Salmonella enterica]EFO9572529.1 YcxB family protein [Salmonella enterica]EGA6593314.1 YcxB family protein [Salmonella enterica]EHM3682717.1 YcxB family protein [Salmonella enterica]